jgi:DNA-binding MarR family transcriptional regulator
MVFSTGNQGVPTDKQTDKQTDNKHEIELKTEEIMENSIDNAAKILDSLDSIKKEIRLKFKRLTEQEILVFSTLYQIDEETGPTDYKTIAKKLGLTESSIRDYVGRLIKKGIPVDKKRINNKIIQLSISQNLKKIASLPTILQLRDI